MDMKDTEITVKNLSFVYFGFTLVLAISEFLSFKPLIYIFKLSTIPLLMTLYYISSREKNKLYFIALLFTFFMNVCMLEPTLQHMFFGQITFVVYRFLTVVLVFKIIKEIKVLSLLIAIIPFLSIFSYLLVLIEKAFFVSIFPSLINLIFMSILGGVSLASYVFNDNKKNTFFLISTILFTAQVFVFVIQKQFSLDVVFQPIAVIIYATSQFMFFRFIMEDENEAFIIDKEIVE